MKRILILLLSIGLVTGCTAIDDLSIEEIINDSLSSKYELHNKVNSGFKFYLPRGLKITKQDELNVIITSKYYDYYLYVDLVSYYNKKDIEYKRDESLVYSELLDYDKKKGIVNIKEVDLENVVIDVTFNYANIQVKVSKDDINKALMNVMAILGNITYQDDVIKSLLDEDILSASDELINVFDTDTNDTQTLDVDDTYTGNEEEDYDPDVIPNYSE